MKNRKYLQQINIYAVLIPCIMPFVFLLLSKNFGKTIGYFVPYGIYLSILLIGILVFGKKIDGITPKYKDNHNLLFWGIAYIPVIATFFVAFLPTLPYITWKMLLILVPYACLNGLLEELFWRYTFNRVFKDDIVLAYILPTIIFTCWHMSMLCANGISFEGGPIALVGGACVMGFMWGYVMFKTKNIYIVVSAHIIVNFFAFSQLIYQNWFM